MSVTDYVAQYRSELEGYRRWLEATLRRMQIGKAGDTEADFAPLPAVTENELGPLERQVDDLYNTYRANTKQALEELQGMEGAVRAEMVRTLRRQVATEVQAVRDTIKRINDQQDFAALEADFEKQDAVRQENIKLLETTYRLCGHLTRPNERPDLSPLCKQQNAFLQKLAGPTKNLASVCREDQARPANEKRAGTLFCLMFKALRGFTGEELQEKKAMILDAVREFMQLNREVNEALHARHAELMAAQAVSDDTLVQRDNVANITQRLNMLEMQYKQALQDLVAEQDTEAEGTVAVPKTTASPVVQIFEVPPPRIDISRRVSAIQDEVRRKLAAFPVSAAPPDATPCLGPGTLTVGQRITYHYMTPFNDPRVNVMLVHSAGSGKTCTGSLITSTFARAGYTMFQVAKESIKDELPKSVYRNGCDFNVQQLMQGQYSPAEAAMLFRGHAEGIANAAEALEAGRRIFEGEAPVARKEKQQKTRAPSPEENDDWAGLEDLLSDLEADVTEEAAPSQEETVQLSAKGARRAAEYLLGTLLPAMGVSRANPPMEAFTYAQLANIADKIRSSERGALGIQERLFGRRYAERGNPPKAGQTEVQRAREKLGDPLHKCIIVVDEAHKIVTLPTDASQRDMVDFKKMRQLIWDSYAKSGENSVRVVLLTATPVADDPMDLVNLASLLAPQELVKRLRFDGYADFYASTPEAARRKKQALADKFMQAEFAKGEYTHPDRLRELFAGRISYFDFSGDRATHAQPFTVDGKSLVEYVPVYLSVYQKDGMARCPVDLDNVANPLLVSAKAKGMFHYNTATKKLVVDPAVPPMRKSDMPSGKGTQECAQMNTMWPVYSPYKGKGRSPEPPRALDLVRDPKLATLQTLRTFSPMLARVVRNVLENSSNAMGRLLKYYREHRTPGRRLQNMKQYIFTDLSNNYGTGLIEAALKAQGFVRVNDKDGNLSEAPAYKGMVVFDRKYEKHAKQKMLSFFNSADNVDGRKALLFVNSGLYKEGMSLYDVRYAHLVGYIASRADLQQAVARAIRNCGHKQSIYNRGWTINVQVYSPVAHGMLHPRELVAMLTGQSEQADVAKEKMNAIMRGAAYDKLILEPLNSASQRVRDSLKLWN